jgi:hypothetical protein
MALSWAKDFSRLDACPAKPPTPACSELKRRLGGEWNGMHLHEVYFGNLTRNRANLEKTAGLGAQLVCVGKQTGSFSLDSKSVNTTVDLSVAVGTKVKIVESKDANGIKTLNVDPAS